MLKIVEQSWLLPPPPLLLGAGDAAWLPPTQCLGRLACAQLGSPGGLEDAAHIVFVCPLYAPIRYRYPELVFEGTLQDFFQQPPLPLARFACDCYYTFQSTPLGAP